MNRTKFLTQSAMIAALYVVLVEVFKPISHGDYAGKSCRSINGSSLTLHQRQYLG